MSSRTTLQSPKHLKKVMLPNSDLPKEEAQVESHSEAIGEKGSLKFSPDSDKLMHSVVENDKETIENGKILVDMVNYGMGFMPSMLYEKLVKDYRMAEKLYGKTLIRRLSGYDSKYIQRNINIPEFQRKLKKSIEEKGKDLKERKLLDDEGHPTEEGYKLSSLILYTEELDSLAAKGLGDKTLKKKTQYGEKEDRRNYRKGDPYRSISVKGTIKRSLRRGRQGEIEMDDIVVHDRKSKGRISIIYCIDASGSMKGRKLEMAKKAGIALAYKALANKDKVGIVVFSDEVKDKVAPTGDFGYLLQRISKVRSGKETSILAAIKEGAELFPDDSSARHLVLLTDAMPTIGDDPKKDTIESAAYANNHNVTISIVGIDLDKEGLSIAKEIAEIGKGRLYKIEDVEDMDKIILQDYYELQ